MSGNGTCGLQALSGFHAAVQWRRYNSYFHLLQKEIDMWRGYRSHTTEWQSWAISPSFWFGIRTPVHETYHMNFSDPLEQDPSSDGGTLRADLGTPSSSAMHLPSSLHGHTAISLCVYVSLSWFPSYCKNAAHWIRALPSLLWAPLISVTPAGNIFSNEVTFTLW